MPVLNALLLGTLMYRSRLVPRIIPIVGLIGAPILFSSTIGTMFAINDTQSLWTGLATMPIFRTDAPILADTARGSGVAPAVATGGAA